MRQVVYTTVVLIRTHLLSPQTCSTILNTNVSLWVSTLSVLPVFNQIYLSLAHIRVFATYSILTLVYSSLFFKPFVPV